MAICDWCRKEMNDPGTVECSANILVDFPDDTSLGVIIYDAGPNDRCHDCNVKSGFAHHPGCDMERCPRCSGQLISCGCLDKAED